MASLSRSMKKAASAVISLANRTPRRNYYEVSVTPLKNSTINTGTNVFRQIPNYHYFCTLANTRSNADGTLLRTIESSIDQAEKAFDDLQVAEIPIECPFKIEDDPEEKFVTLTREFEDEEIKLTIPIPYNCFIYYSSDDDEEEEDEIKDVDGTPMSVSVAEKGSETLIFHIVANPYKFAITSMAFKKPNASGEGYEFSNFDKNLLRSLHTYLEIRGITPTTFRFLHNYLVNKEHKKRILWLEKLKNIIAS